MSYTGPAELFHLKNDSGDDGRGNDTNDDDDNDGGEDDNDSDHGEMCK